MILLAGLGNPGARYRANRHNIGFMALDAIVARHPFAAWRQRFQAQCAEGRIADTKVLALKPQTFMNESGRAVGQAARFYRIEPENTIVIHDELDLAPGKMRVKAGGGAAGHNGVRSIARHVGADFRRVRLGIGHPGEKGKVRATVLNDFSGSEAAWVGPLLDAIADNAALLVEGCDSTFMNRVHLALNPSREAEEKDGPE